jgi:uncharacterized protein YcbX
MTEIAEVVSLHVYPVKSCAGTSLAGAPLSERGFAFDREWMVTDPDGVFLSQRQHPELALVNPRLGIGRLSISAPGMEDLSLDTDNYDYERITARVWESDAPAIRQSREADGWLSDYLRKPVYLVRFDRNRERQVSEHYRTPGYTDRVAFADDAPILIASLPSLRALNERLDEPVPMDRFRPNVELDGKDLPAFDEDYWRRLQIGRMSGRIGWACARCVTVENRQDTGFRSKGVLKALQEFRRGINAVHPTIKKVFFAQNFLPDSMPGTTVNVGDKVEVIERSDERNILGI